jgi:hypothetical protein
LSDTPGTGARREAGTQVHEDVTVFRARASVMNSQARERMINETFVGKLSFCIQILSTATLLWGEIGTQSNLQNEKVGMTIRNDRPG